MVTQARLADARRPDEVRVWAHDGFLAQVAAFWMARKVFAFGRDAELIGALDRAWADLRAAVRDRGFTFGHLLRDVDRMLYAVPAARKSYAGQDEVLATLLQALFFSRRVRIRYRSLEPAAPRPHTLGPLTLVFRRSALYIVAAYTPGAPGGETQVALARLGSAAVDSSLSYARFWRSSGAGLPLPSPRGRGPCAFPQSR